MVLSKNELGKLVKNARGNKAKKIGKKYTQIMLAADIGKSQGYIGDIESGRTYPTFRVLSRIAEACEVPFSFFDDAEANTLKKIINIDYPDMNYDEVREFSNHIISILKASKSYPNIDIDIVKELDLLKIMYDDFKKEENTCNYLDKENCDYTSPFVDKDSVDYISVDRSVILDAKSAIDLILSQPGLMLNGEILSDDSKLALENAIKLGLQYAEQMQKKEKENK